MRRTSYRISLFPSTQMAAYALGGLSRARACASDVTARECGGQLVRLLTTAQYYSQSPLAYMGKCAEAAKWQ